MHWSFSAPIGVVLLGFALLAGTGWLCYSNWNRERRKSSVAMLEILRFVLVGLLMFTLLKPEFVEVVQRTESPSVVILTDRSGSMQTRDVVVSNNVITRAQWIDQALQAEFWKPLEPAAEASVEFFGGRSALTNAAPGTPEPVEGTDLNGALTQVIKVEKNLKAVVLLSDGDWNTGGSPVGTAVRFQSQGVPSYAVSVGQESPLPDLAIEKVAAPSYSLFGEQVSVPFVIASHLSREVRTTITLFDGEREESKREIILPAGGRITQSIIRTPREVGERTLTLKLPAESDEALRDNNEQKFHVSIRLETLKVLVVDSLPRWEYRYLRNALERDPGVEAHCILFHPGMDTGGGRLYLSAFPGSKEALSRYDVIFLGDVGIGDDELTENDATLIRGLVEQQSSGLIFLPGKRGRQLTFANSPLADLLPVVLDATRPGGVTVQNEANLQLTALGSTHFLTRFEADELLDAELWKNLPGYFWSAAVERARPGTDVLGVHAGIRSANGQRMPLLATRQAGSGKVLFMGTDSAWRWRRGVEDKYHYRFWSQVVRWMAHQRHLSEKDGIRLSYSPEAPQLGDTMFLQSTVLDASGFPIQEGPVLAKITAPSGRTEQATLNTVEGGWGVFKTSFTPSESGTYRIQVSSARHGRSLDTDILVSRPELEKVGQPINMQVLREISQISHGATKSVSALPELIREISLLPEVTENERRTRIWSNPWWGGTILALLCIYWVGRKLYGMI